MYEERTPVIDICVLNILHAPVAPVALQYHRMALIMCLRAWLPAQLQRYSRLHSYTTSAKLSMKYMNSAN